MPKALLLKYTFTDIGEWRWSQKNRSFRTVDYSPIYDIPIWMVFSFFPDRTMAVGFFADKSTSEIERFENISHFNYGPVRKDFTIPKKGGEGNHL